MSHQNQSDARVQAILAELLQAQLAKSLQTMDESLEQWRNGDLGVFETHAEVLKHAARAERMASRIAKIDPEDLPSFLRDAFDMGVMERDEFISLTGDEPDQVEPAGGLDDGLSTPLKRDMVSELLDRGPILVHVDGRSSEISVPQHLTSDPKLVLRFGYHLTPPIHDLEVTEHALSGTLTFRGVPHHCILPWSAVYAVISEVDQRGMVWPEDVPKVVLEQMAEENHLPAAGSTPAEVTTEPESTRSSRLRRASHLKLVD